MGLHRVLYILDLHCACESQKQGVWGDRRAPDRRRSPCGESTARCDAKQGLFAVTEAAGARYFEACAEGRLLMIASAAWEWTPAEIDYHGMKPANIDALALTAVAPPRVHAEDLV